MDAGRVVVVVRGCLHTGRIDEKLLLLLLLLLTPWLILLLLLLLLLLLPVMYRLIRPKLKPNATTTYSN